MPVIDVHTHMLNRQWLALLQQRGPPKYTVSRSLEGQETILSEGAQFLTPMPAHLDYELRLKHMDEACVDLAIVSLTAPNVFFGDEQDSIAAARLVMTTWHRRSGLGRTGFAGSRRCPGNIRTRPLRSWRAPTGTVPLE